MLRQLSQTTVPNKTLLMFIPFEAYIYIDEIVFGKDARICQQTLNL